MERWKITYLEASMQRDCDMGTLGKAESYLGDVREWEAIIQGEGRLGSC